MLIRMISALAQDKDDVRQRLTEDIEPVLEAYGITEEEREALRSRDTDKVRTLLEKELDACIAVVAFPEIYPEDQRPIYQGAPLSDVEARAVLAAQGLTSEDLQALRSSYTTIRIQAMSQIKTRMLAINAMAFPVPTPWPPNAAHSNSPVVTITPDNVNTGATIEVTIARHPTAAKAPTHHPLNPGDFQLSFKHSDGTIVSTSVTTHKETMEKLVRSVRFTKHGKYGLLVEGPTTDDQRVEVAPAGMNVNPNRDQR